MQDKCNQTYKTNREPKLIEVSFLVWTAMCVWLQVSLLALTTSHAKQLPLTCVKFERLLSTWVTPLAQVRHYPKPPSYSRCKHQPRSWYHWQNSHTTTLESWQHNRFVVLQRPWGNCHLNCNWLWHVDVSMWLSCPQGPPPERPVRTRYFPKKINLGTARKLCTGRDDKQVIYFIWP